MTDAMWCRPGDVPAGENNFAAIRQGSTRDHIEQRRLSGAVGASNAENLAAIDLKAEILNRCHGAEIFADATADQQRLFVSKRHAYALIQGGILNFEVS
jgi:hypothetical protein